MAKYEDVSLKIQDTFIRLYEKKEIHTISVKALCAEVGIPRTSFYNYYSDIYDVLESIENQIISDLKYINRDFYRQDFRNCKKEEFAYFLPTLHYIRDHIFWFRVLMNKSQSGQFIYKWKKIIKEDFSDKYHKDDISLGNEDMMLEMISSGCMGIYTYWVNNPESVSIETLIQEALFYLCHDFIFDFRKSAGGVF